jgi:uncharacterized protein YoxC
MLLLLQAGDVPAWVGPTMAISLVIIALSFMVIAGAIGLAIARVLGEIRKLHNAVESLRGDLNPALTAVRAISDEGRRLASVIGGEAEELVAASRALRAGLTERVQNLEAVYEVLQDEVEETAIDLAITLRGFRRGAGWYGRIRRLLGAGRR